MLTLKEAKKRVYHIQRRVVGLKKLGLTETQTYKVLEPTHVNKKVLKIVLKKVYRC